jgi:Activator of Hsp90 ATPase homolog 1-like protein
MPDAARSLTPLRKTVVVPVEQSRAFELFTAHFDEWWPLSTHSVGLHDAQFVSFPREVGGSILETTRDGRTCAWGTVTKWDPPVAVCFSWHPGQPESWAGEIEVRFIADGAATLVALTHSGWDRRADGASARVGYDRGWEVVLAGLEGLSAALRSP